MIDNAAIAIQNGAPIALERIASINDNTLQSHYHPFYELFYLEEGKRSVVIDERSYDLKPGDFVIYPPYTMHRSFSAHNVSFSRIVLYFMPATIPQELREALNDKVEPYELISEHDKHAIIEQIEALITEQTKSGKFQDDALQSRLKLLLISALRAEYKTPQPRSEPKMTAIIAYIQQHYFEPGLSLDELAARFFISKSYLCREFKRFTSLSFVAYLNRIRVLHAQRLFVESDKTITAIAAEVGFGSLTHFERVFAQHTQSTPKRMCASMRLMRDHPDSSTQPSHYESAKAVLGL